MNKTGGKSEGTSARMTQSKITAGTTLLMYQLPAATRAVVGGVLITKQEYTKKYQLSNVCPGFNLVNQLNSRFNIQKIQPKLTCNEGCVSNGSR